MDRVYLDFNATSPLAASVTRWLAKGEFFWANPASQHGSGKAARARLDEASDAIARSFGTTHRLHFHSGVTEAVNTWAAGLAPGALFAYAPTDHSCVRAQVERLERQGHPCLALPVDHNGELRLDEAIAQLQQRMPAAGAWVNWTWVQNETGVVWPLKDAVQLQAATGVRVHVDAAQAPGKVEGWNQLSPELDAYSFSAHKFGALKGVGFTFVHPQTTWVPLLKGGGQQGGLRAGTENPMGAWSVKLALEDLTRDARPAETLTLMSQVRRELDGWLVGKGERIAAGARQLNCNTALFVVHPLRSDMALPLFDLAGLELSMGSACGSGTAKASHVLEVLGHEKWARHGLRLSLPWAFTAEDWAKWAPRLAQVFEKLKKS